MNACSTADCERPVANKKRGLCRRCYFYWLATEAPHRPLCPVDQCDRRVWAKGLCDIHYKRASRNGGDPMAAPGRGSPGKRRGIRSLRGEYMTTSGYRRIRDATGRWIDEHRLVMEQKIGRPLLPGENVHHIDGNRLNNAQENLELWITRQPSGQQVEDVVAWAREVIARYG